MNEKDEKIAYLEKIIALSPGNIYWKDKEWLQDQALAMFTDKYYDFVFLDIGLPDIDGFEVAKEMRYKEVERGYTPIIGITGYNTDEDKEKCFLVGMDEVTIKPVKQEEFNEILQRWLSKKSNLQKR